MVCAACKFLRRKCTQECVFAPFFLPWETEKFKSVHTVFGASNVAKLLSELHFNQRGDAVVSLVYEAQARQLNPVHGPVALISDLQQQLSQIQHVIETRKSELATNVGPQAMMIPISQPPQPHSMSSSVFVLPQHHHNIRAFGEGSSTAVTKMPLGDNFVPTGQSYHQQQQQHHEAQRLHHQQQQQYHEAQQLHHQQQHHEAQQLLHQQQHQHHEAQQLHHQQQHHEAQRLHHQQQQQHHEAQRLHHQQQQQYHEAQQLHHQQQHHEAQQLHHQQQHQHHEAQQLHQHHEAQQLHHHHQQQHHEAQQLQHQDDQPLPLQTQETQPNSESEETVVGFITINKE